MSAAKHEPAPLVNSKPFIYEKVIMDVVDRAAAGKAKYGTFLQPNNGRNALMDLYQELLDAVHYTRQLLDEQVEKQAAVIKQNLENAKGLFPEKINYDLHLDPAGDSTRDALKHHWVHDTLTPVVGKIVPHDGPIPPEGKLSAREFMPKDESILKEAHRLVHGDRGSNYGHPLDDMGRTAGMLNALLAHKLSMSLDAGDVAKIMVCVKLSRETNRPKRDNRVDLAGYAETLDMIVNETERRRKEVQNGDTFVRFNPEKFLP